MVSDWNSCKTKLLLLFTISTSIDASAIICQRFKQSQGNTVSQLYGIGKLTAWKAFQKYGALLNDLGRGILSDPVERNVEKFICRLYSSNEGDTHINDVCFKMFLKGTN